MPASAAAILAQRAKIICPTIWSQTEREWRHSESLRRQELASTLQFEGRGEIANFHLTSAGNKADIRRRDSSFSLDCAGIPSRGNTRLVTTRLRSPALEGPHSSSVPSRLRSGTADVSDGSRMDQPQRLQHFGRGRDRDSEGFANGANGRASGAAVAPLLRAQLSLTCRSTDHGRRARLELHRDSPHLK